MLMWRPPDHRGAAQSTKRTEAFAGWALKGLKDLAWTLALGSLACARRMREAQFLEPKSRLQVILVLRISNVRHLDGSDCELLPRNTSVLRRFFV